MANEWNEIQTHRKINSFIVLMLSLLFLETIGLGNFAERSPSMHVTTPTERYTAPHSSVLRIGLAIIVYLLIALISVRGGGEGRSILMHKRTLCIRKINKNEELSSNF